MAYLQILVVGKAAFRFCMEICFQNIVLFFICEEGNFLSNGAVYLDV